MRISLLARLTKGRMFKLKYCGVLDYLPASGRCWNLYNADGHFLFCIWDDDLINDMKSSACERCGAERGDKHSPECEAGV